MVTIVVRTRGAHDELRRCLDALFRLEYDSLDVVVADSGGESDSVSRFLADRYSDTTYVHVQDDAHPWLERVLASSRGDVVACIDSATIVDRWWVSSLVRVFMADSEVMAVTGPAIPWQTDGVHNLSVELGAGQPEYVRRWFRAPASVDGGPLPQRGAMPGSASNVAIWRAVLENGYGVASWNAGRRAPADILDRVLCAGHTVVYEPSAIVRTMRATQSHIAKKYGRGTADGRPARREARRSIDLSDPLRPIADATDHARLTVAVSWDGRQLGQVRIEHHGARVSTLWLGDEIARQLRLPILDARTRIGEEGIRAVVTAGLARALMPALQSYRRPRSVPEVVPGAPATPSRSGRLPRAA